MTVFACNPESCMQQQGPVWRIAWYSWLLLERATNSICSSLDASRIFRHEDRGHRCAFLKFDYRVLKKSVNKNGDENGKRVELRCEKGYAATRQGVEALEKMTCPAIGIDFAFDGCRGCRHDGAHVNVSE